MLDLGRHSDFIIQSAKEQVHREPLDIESRTNSEYQHLFGNKVHRTAFVAWEQLEIGTGNVIGPFACIGGDAQHKSAESTGKVVIGNNNTFREFSTIHRPTDPSIGTIVGDGNYIMAGAHINHDCILENDIVLCNNATLAGKVYVMSGAFLSMNCSVHQNQIIGSWSIIGMNSCVTKSAIVEPGYKFFGVPAKKHNKNTVSLRRNKVSPRHLEAAKNRFNALCVERSRSKHFS